MKKQQYHDDSGRELWLECDRESCRVRIISRVPGENLVTLDIMVTDVDPFGLPERELRLVRCSISLYPHRDKNDECQSGGYAIPGSFNQDWMDRLYFRLNRDS